jgi:hypothetical protein
MTENTIPRQMIINFKEQETLDDPEKDGKTELEEPQQTLGPNV